VGIINTIFVYSLYSVLVFTGLNLYVSQILSHVSGVVFNYFMFKGIVFKNNDHRVFRYVIAYTLNYVLGFCFLSITHHFIKSPYIAGFVALVGVSIVNYFVLKGFVFKTTGVGRQ